MRYLDPGDFRLDAILRGPLPGGDWGEPGVFGLTIRAEEESVLAAEGISRPSHTSLFARTDGGLQITEDRFQATDGTHVSVVSLRNAGEYSLDVSVSAAWQDPNLVRISPPGDDCFQRLPSETRLQLIFAAGESHERASGWAAERSPVRRHTDFMQAWLDLHAPRFDCPDPARLRGFYQCWHERWLQQDPALGEDSQIVALLSPEFSGQALTLRPDPCGMEHFCLADWPVGAARLTVVWDDPKSPLDNYDDGLKGLAIWQGERLLHRQDDLTPLTLTL
jgi:hypothetical protein